MFQQITISISLSESMQQAMPESGTEEMTAIDKHSATINRALVDPLKEAAVDLVALGYSVHIDE